VNILTGKTLKFTPDGVKFGMRMAEERNA